MVDLQANEFFRGQVEDDEFNGLCYDCGTADASWASVSHGIYLSIGAAGLHRSLGVKVSFVQSTTMDSWRPLHLRMMELGGNRRFDEFMREQGVPADMPIRKKYTTRAAEWYRRNLRALAEGTEPLEQLPAGTGHLPAGSASSSAQQVLDKVFKEAPHSGSMTSGGVLDSRSRSRRHPSREVRHSAPAAVGRSRNAGVSSEQLEPVARGAAEVRSAALRRSRTVSVLRSDDHATTSQYDHNRWWPLVPMPALLTPTKCLTAARLQKMSSGKMEGFGSDSFSHKPPAVIADKEHIDTVAVAA